MRRQPLLLLCLLLLVVASTHAVTVVTKTIRGYASLCEEVPAPMMPGWSQWSQVSNAQGQNFATFAQALCSGNQESRYIRCGGFNLASQLPATSGPTTVRGYDSASVKIHARGSDFGQASIYSLRLANTVSSQGYTAFVTDKAVPYQQVVTETFSFPNFWNAPATRQFVSDEVAVDMKARGVISSVNFQAMKFTAVELAINFSFELSLVSIDPSGRAGNVFRANDVITVRGSGFLQMEEGMNTALCVFGTSGTTTTPITIVSESELTCSVPTLANGQHELFVSLTGAGSSEDALMLTVGSVGGPTPSPTNPTPQPTNPTPQPTNPTPQPTNPTPQPTNPTPAPVANPNPAPAGPNPAPAPGPSPNPNPAPEPSPNPNPAPEPSPNPNPAPEPSPNPTPAPEPSPNPKPAPEPSPNPNPAPEPSPNPNPAPGPSPNPNPAPVPNPNPAPGPGPNPNPAPAPGPGPNPNPAPGPSPPVSAPTNSNSAPTPRGPPTQAPKYRVPLSLTGTWTGRLNFRAALGPSYAQSQKRRFARTQRNPFMTPLSTDIKVFSVFSVGDSVEDNVVTGGDVSTDPATTTVAMTTDATATANTPATVTAKAPFKYRLGGVLDGQGGYVDPVDDSLFWWFVNHELERDAPTKIHAHLESGAYVTRLLVERKTLRVLAASDLVTKRANFAGPLARLCSGTMPEVSALYNDVTGAGTQERLFLAGEESDFGRAFAFVTSGAENGTAYHLPAMGAMRFENVVPCPIAQSNLTVTALPDDKSVHGGLWINVGRKQTLADNPNANIVELAGLGMDTSTLYGIAIAGVEGALLDDTFTLPGGEGATLKRFSLVEMYAPDAPRPTVSNEMRDFYLAKGGTLFGRPEDVVWDRRRPNEFYMATTNQGRLYRFTFDDVLTQPEAGGTVEMVLNGVGENADKTFALDNLAMDRHGRMLITEDSTSRNNRMLAYDVDTDTLVPIGRHHLSRSMKGDEFSGVFDAEDLLGPGWFLFSDQRHSDKFLTTKEGTEAVDGGRRDPALISDGQLMAVYVPPTFFDDQAAAVASSYDEEADQTVAMRADDKTAVTVSLPSSVSCLGADEQEVVSQQVEIEWLEESIRVATRIASATDSGLVSDLDVVLPLFGAKAGAVSSQAGPDVALWKADLTSRSGENIVRGRTARDGREVCFYWKVSGVDSGNSTTTKVAQFAAVVSGSTAQQVDGVEGAAAGDASFNALNCNAKAIQQLTSTMWDSDDEGAWGAKHAATCTSTPSIEAANVDDALAAGSASGTMDTVVTGVLSCTNGLCGPPMILPDALPDNTLVIDLTQDKTGYTVRASKNIVDAGNPGADGKVKNPRLKLKRKVRYTFFAQQPCDYPAYVSASADGGDFYVPPEGNATMGRVNVGDNILADRLDDGEFLVGSCGGLAFDLKATNGFPSTLYYRSSMHPKFGGRIELPDALVAGANKSVGIARSVCVLLALVLVVLA